MPKESSFPYAVQFLWQQAIEAAVNESDPKKSLEKIYAADAAIFSRLQELAQNCEDSKHQQERQAITDSCKTFWNHKRDALGYPDWK
jgi:hypothetical protein